MSESLEFEDIQGLLVSGYADRPLASYLLLRVVDGPAVRRWLGARLDRLQFSEFRSTGRAAEPGLASLCINAAFTASGLTALGLDREVLQGFSREFVEGMDRPARARLLGDDGDSAPATWDWGQAPDIHGVRSVDMLLALFSADASCGEGARSPEIERFVNEEITAASGLDLVQRLDSWPLGPHGRKEHFGFRDGLSNPRIEGLASGSGSGASEQPLPAGEVLLGHENVYGGPARGPTVCAQDDPAEILVKATRDGRRDLGRNGSYLVFRQLSQDVQGFWDFAVKQGQVRAEGSSGGEGAVWLASRMVGRWPNGSPIVRHPDASPPDDEADLGDFKFAEEGARVGGRCPVGAHVRRANPRDTLLPNAMERPVVADPAKQPEQVRADRMELVRRRRILRRGRPYGLPVDVSMEPERLRLGDDRGARGLCFLCFNGNISRQFEFVQSTWMINPCFASLPADPDPLVGADRQHPFSASGFTMRDQRHQYRLEGMPRFVQVKGGAYFFMPGRRALEFLCQSPAARRFERVSAGERVAVGALERLHLEKIRAASRARPDAPAPRGFHTKGHGLLRAVFQVADDIPEGLQEGLFARSGRYPAWVRFSNGSFRPAPDGRPDVHGLAIKVMGVEGHRLDGARSGNQDLVLIDSPRLMVPDVLGALGFDRAMVRGGWAALAYLLRSPRVAMRLASMVSAPDSLLGSSYHGVTRYALGDVRAVRYLLRPVSPLAELHPAVPENAPDGLRQDLQARLASEPFRFDLHLLLEGGGRGAVEDASIAGPEERGVRVASLWLQPEPFDLPEREALQARVRFDPWNGLAAHRPLGGINRARRVVYRASALLRNRLNGTAVQEPACSGSWPGLKGTEALAPVKPCTEKGLGRKIGAKGGARVS